MAVFVRALIDRMKPFASPALAMVVVGVVIAALDHLIHAITYADIVQALHAVASIDLLLALVATGASYALLTGYDFSSLRYVGARVDRRAVAVTSFVAYALGNSVGVGVLTGGAVRYRLYSAAGVEANAIAKAVAFNAVAFGVGVATIGSLGLLTSAHQLAPALHLPSVLLQGAATFTLIISTVLVVLCFLRKGRVVPHRLQVILPSGWLALSQWLISMLEVLAASACLWFLLPPSDLTFTTFFACYALAIMVGVISHVPGGLGIFEVIMLAGLGEAMPQEQLVAALLMYRCLYFFLPLALAIFLLAGFELRQSIALPVVKAAARLSPVFLGAALLGVAVMLLVSGALPATDEATALLAMHVPLPLVEASHLISSLIGLLMLFVVRGILHRLDAAWWAATLVTLLAALMAIPKGISVLELSVLGYLVIMLMLSRKEFDRRASLFEQRFTAGWWLMIACVVALVVWILFFAYRDVEYGHELWRQFEIDGHAPRSMRATLAILLIAVGMGLWQMLRPQRVTATLPDTATIERARQILLAQSRPDMGLALMGDKQFIFSHSGRSFLMYGIRDRSMVALFDPVGVQAEWPELVWRFIEMADQQGVRAAFYQVSAECLPLYLDAGLRVYKLGEYAWVNLKEFSLQGARRAKLRHGFNRAEREGLSVEIISPESVPAHMAELKSVSDAWLKRHGASEKGFSLGTFDPGYVARNPVALVRQGERLVAFATLLTTALKSEATIDLMRQRQDAPACTMEYLFVRLMQHFQQQGYERFGLGMAPLSGMVEHPLAPGWHRFARLLFTHGESLYNFQGLRSFKQKFDPQWEPRYLAAQGGVRALRSSLDVAALISGGLRKAIKL